MGFKWASIGFRNPTWSFSEDSKGYQRGGFMRFFGASETSRASMRVLGGCESVSRRVRGFQRV